MKDLHAALSGFEAEFQRLASGVTGRRKKALIDFGKIVNNLNRNLQRIWDLGAKRQFLIDVQCNSKIFHGQLHEEYHQTNELLDDAFNNFFLLCETALSRFSTLVHELLPHSDNTGISHGGFSRFLNSIKKLEEAQLLPPSLKPIALILSREGREIETQVSRYRDHKIEHVSDNFVEGFETTGEGQIWRTHGKRKDSYTGASPAEKLDRSRIPPTCILEAPDGKNRIYYLHVETLPNIEGKALNKGAQLGNVSDNNSGHFEDHGPHTHIFSTPLLGPDKIGPFTSREIERSPDPGIAAAKIVSFFTEVLKYIQA